MAALYERQASSEGVVTSDRSDWEDYYITLTITGRERAISNWRDRPWSPGSKSIPTRWSLTDFVSFFFAGSRTLRECGRGRAESIRLDADFSMGYLNTAWAYVYQNRLTEAEAMLDKASEHTIDIVELSLSRYFIAFLKGDKLAMDKERARRTAKFGVQ
jgi:hypothetical protein